MYIYVSSDQTARCFGDCKNDMSIKHRAHSIYIVTGRNKCGEYDDTLT